MSHCDPVARACPILPVQDLDRALDHYARMGATVSRHDDSYGFATMAGVELHLTVVPGHDPLRGAAAVFVHVPDADELAAAWAAVEETRAPVDTDYGMREGAHIDPDGNLLRFGSPLPSQE